MGKSGSAAVKSFDILKALVWQAYYPLLQRINTYLMRWAGKKYKRLRSYRRFHAWWLGIVRHGPRAVSHTGDGCARSRSPNCDEKSGVTGDCHAPFRGSPGVRVPRATRLSVSSTCWPGLTWTSPQTVEACTMRSGHVRDTEEVRS